MWAGVLYFTELLSDVFPDFFVVCYLLFFNLGFDLESKVHDLGDLIFQILVASLLKLELHRDI